MLNIPELALTGSHDWALPPSKSHMIRWLALTSQGRSECLLRFEGKAGADVESMALCLEAMGVQVHRGADGWLVEPPNGGCLLYTSPSPRDRG